MPQTPPPFVKKTYELVSDDSTNEIVCWSPLGDSFIIYQPHTLQTEILPKYFKHNNLCSFVRQLNTYDFRKIVDTDSSRTEELEFKNDYFKKDQPELLKSISRKKPGKRTVSQRDVSDILGNSLNSPDPLRNLSNEEINVLATNCLGQPSNSVEDLRKLMTDNSAMINAIVTLSEKQQQAENMLLAVTKELTEAKKLIASLKQERNIPISPNDFMHTPPIPSAIPHNSLTDINSTPTPEMPILPVKQNCYLAEPPRNQNWNTVPGSLPPNTISQPYPTAPMVNIPSRTEVAAVAQERKKQQEMKHEPNHQPISQWNVSVPVGHPVNSNIQYNKT